MKRMSCLLFVSIYFLAIPVHAKFAFASAPTPGEWAKYRQVVHVTSFGEMPQTFERHVFVRCLPFDGDRSTPHLWIELEIESRDEARKIYKILLPESSFTSGGDLLEDFVAGWVLNVRSEAREDDPNRKSNRAAAPIGENEKKSIATWFAAPAKDAEQLMSDYVEIDNQKFLCQGIACQRKWLLNNCEYVEQIETRFSNETPFALILDKRINVTLMQKREISKVTTTTAFVSSGNNAASAIPDN